MSNTSNTKRLADGKPKHYGHLDHLVPNVVRNPFRFALGELWSSEWLPVCRWCHQSQRSFRFRWACSIAERESNYIVICSPIMCWLHVISLQCWSFQSQKEPYKTCWCQNSWALKSTPRIGTWPAQTGDKHALFHAFNHWPENRPTNCLENLCQKILGRINRIPNYLQQPTPNPPKSYFVRKKQLQPSSLMSQETSSRSSRQRTKTNQRPRANKQAKQKAKGRSQRSAQLGVQSSGTPKFLYAGAWLLVYMISTWQLRQ